LRHPLGVGRQSDLLAALMVVLLTACGGTRAATTAATTSAVASASVSPTTASASAATTTAAIRTASRAVSSSSSVVTTAPLVAALSIASRLATSTATGSAGGGPVAEKLVFTGVVTGTVTSSPAPGDCGKRDIAPLDTVLHVFRFDAITAKLADGAYDVGLQINQYTGPGTYGQDRKAILSVKNGGSGVEYLNLQDTDTTVVVVAPDEASGTIEANFSDPLGGDAKGHVSGSWRCR
jgi:hypothetical protein